MKEQVVSIFVDEIEGSIGRILSKNSHVTRESIEIEFAKKLLDPKKNVTL